METTCTGDIALDALATTLSSLRLCQPKRVRQIQQSLSRQGQLTPLLGHHADPVEIIDGFKRLEAARRLGWPTLAVRVLDCNSAAAKVSMVLANARSGIDDVEEAWLVRALYRQDRLTQPHIGRLFGRNKSWVCRRLALAEQLEATVETDIRLGLLSVTAARELARLPRGNQRTVTDVVINRALTSRQAARLVNDVLAKPSDLRAILAKADMPSADARPQRKTPCEKIAADVANITTASSRLQARLHERPLAAFADATSIVESLKTLDLVLLALRQTIARVTDSEAR